MSVRFEPAARRAVDQALAECEQLGHGTLDPLHLVIGLVSQRDGQVAAAFRTLGVDTEALRAAALHNLGPGPDAGSPPVAVAPATERVLERAHRISAQRSADAVSDLDILIACAQELDTPAGAVLDDFGVTAARLWAVYSSERGLSGDPGVPGRDGDEARDPERGRARDGGAPAGRPALAAARSGIGYDSHRFAPGGPLVLGGVTIPSDVRLAGHSDGDAIAHAVTDAILGAAGAGDIGQMFSDRESANRGRNSLEMLAAAVARVRAAGLAVHHIDVTVVSETPQIAPHREAMRAALARALAIGPGEVSVKGKTNEGMGWIGRGEGLACIAVATLVPLDAQR